MNYETPSLKIELLGYRNRTDTMRLIEESGILLNLGNFNKTLVPSKIFEYMSLCKLVISTVDIKEDSSREYLENYKNFFSSMMITHKMILKD